MNPKKSLPGLQKSILLKNHTTFKIGGRAKYFFIAKTKKDLIKAVKTAEEFKLPLFILGGGSNVLISDKGFDGLVIKMQNSKLKTKNYNSKLKTIYAESGTRLGSLIKFSSEKSLTNLEWAAGIPGTIGGAIRGNAGAFEKSIADIIKTVEVYNLKDEKIKIFKNKNLPHIARQNLDSYSARIKDCKFNYRDSIFKKKKKLIILSAVLQLKKGNKKEIQKKIKEFLNYRKKTQPLNFPSTGSVFRNPPDFPAGYLIEECGLKGKKIGNVKISEKHANFIVNLGKGKAKDVKKLINLAKKKVKNKFKINLEEEIEFI